MLFAVCLLTEWQIVAQSSVVLSVKSNLSHKNSLLIPQPRRRGCVIAGVYFISPKVTGYEIFGRVGKWPKEKLVSSRWSVVSRIQEFLVILQEEG